MIRKLGGHMRARCQQLRLFHEHLQAQYSDRLLYWESRGLSRKRNGPIITMIADGMDQSKWDLPRDPHLKAKEFSKLQKLKMHLTCVVCHGHFVLFGISMPDVKKDGNTSVELLSFALTLLQRKGICLAATHVCLQHDNTCREFKNNNGLRWCCSQDGAMLN